MRNFFNKAAVFGDIHFGLKNNSKTHNDDCSKFIDWFIDISKKEKCETCIFLGDWHHQRNTINVNTLNYTVENISKLSSAFTHVYMITGNHDLFYREKRDLYSFPFANLYENITIINDKPYIKDNIALIPWLVEDEWKSIPNIDAKYIFGHFELPYFQMNAMVEMPDHGGLKKEDFTKPEYVFSGHFHKRQKNGNIHYIGSPFAHNYNDAWDNERGMMILEWDKIPKYIDWNNGPTYITLKLSDLIENPNTYLKENMYTKVYIDIQISYEESLFLKESFIETFKLREFTLLQQTEESNEWKGDAVVSFENVDQIVYNQIKNIDSEKLDKNILAEIYKAL
jgi:DNA repair exonuclease SbcCD nuclease subunit